jgi:hypothetical protein
LPIFYKDKRAVREEYIKLQNGKCYYCGEPLDKRASSNIRCQAIDVKLFPKGFFNYPIHLHHNHNTGMTIGAVHCYCNAVMWQYDDE